MPLPASLSCVSINQFVGLQLGSKARRLCFHCVDESMLLDCESPSSLIALTDLKVTFSHSFSPSTCVLSLCFSVCLHILKTTQLKFTRFFLYVACDYGLILLWWHCDMLCSLFGVKCFHTMDRPYHASCVVLSSDSIGAKISASILTRFHSAVKIIN